MAASTPRRRLPALGVTTVGLAVSAGTLGLYRGAAADPAPAPHVGRPPAGGPPETADWVPAAPVAAKPEPVVPAEPMVDAAVVPAALAAPVEVPGPVVVPPAVPDLPPVVAVPVAVPALPPVPAPVRLPAPMVVPVAAPAAEVAPMPRVRPEVARPMPPVTIDPPAVPEVPAPAAVVVPAPVPVGVPGPAELSLPPAADGLTLRGTPAAPPAPPGESAVPPTLIKGVRTAVAGLAVAASAAHPAPAEDPKPMTVPAADRVAELEKKLAAQDAKIADQAKTIATLQDEVLGKAEAGSTVLSLRQQIRTLQDSFQRLQDKYAKLEAKAGPSTTSAFAVVGPKGVVTLVNEYAVPVTMVLNGTGHRLNPGETKPVEVKAGAYTFELLDAGAGKETKTIADGDAVTLRVKAQ